MDRKEYLDWCRDCSVLPRDTGGIKKRVPDNRKVVFDGITYYPQAYLLSFDESGRAVHTAVLYDLNANSMTYCPLQRVEKLKGGVQDAESI